MKGIQTEIEISASATTVWETLTDFLSYAEWNPYILTATATFAVGSAIEFLEEIPGRGRFTIKAVFTRIEPEQEFRWRGHYIVPFILEVNHYFILEAIAPSQTRFKHGQNQTGILVPLLSWHHHFDRLRDAYIAMNQALKVRCESCNGKTE